MFWLELSIMSPELAFKGDRQGAGRGQHRAG